MCLGSLPSLLAGVSGRNRNLGDRAELRGPERPDRSCEAPSLQGRLGNVVPGSAVSSQLQLCTGEGAQGLEGPCVICAPGFQ